MSDVEGPRAIPVTICRSDHLGRPLLPPNQRTRQIEGQLAVISRLPGDRIPCAAVSKVAHAIWILLRNIVRHSELNQGPERIADDLTQQATHGSIQRIASPYPGPCQHRL